MRIAVMAAGAVGGYFGGRMAAAGHDVASLRAAPIAMLFAGMASRLRARSATFTSKRSM
jgi:ketopantoate reductase